MKIGNKVRLLNGGGWYWPRKEIPGNAFWCFAADSQNVPFYWDDVYGKVIRITSDGLIHLALFRADGVNISLTGYDPRDSESTWAFRKRDLVVIDQETPLPSLEES